MIILSLNLGMQRSINREQKRGFSTSFGVTIKERTFAAQNTRYQFNGKEYDNETETSDFGARNLDGDLGVWETVDPQFSRQPGWSTYKAFLDNPIIYQDPDGETEFLSVVLKDQNTGKAYVTTRIISDKLSPGAVKLVGSNATPYDVREWNDIHHIKVFVKDKDGNITLENSITKNIPTGIKTSGPFLDSDLAARAQQWGEDMDERIAKRNSESIEVSEFGGDYNIVPDKNDPWLSGNISATKSKNYIPGSNNEEVEGGGDVTRDQLEIGDTFRVESKDRSGGTYEHLNYLDKDGKQRATSTPKNKKTQDYPKLKQNK